MSNNKEQVKEKIIFRTPNKYEVIILNDDHTPFNHVESVLMIYFEKNEQEARRITLNVHEQGEGVCGVYIKQIAETKLAAANNYSHANNQKLKLIMRPEK